MAHKRPLAAGIVYATAKHQRDRLDDGCRLLWPAAREVHRHACVGLLNAGMANRVSAPLPDSIVLLGDYVIARRRFTATR